MIVNQWVPAAHRGDAIGDSARAVRSALRRRGHQSDLFALTVDDDLRGDVLPFADPLARRGDVTILHFALPSPMTAALTTLAGGRVLQYHNITPAHFFAGYDAQLARLAMIGRDELAAVAGHVDIALGDSQYNREELDRLGFAPTAVFPIAVNLDRLRHGAPRPALTRILDDGLVNFLFVGRVAPNKRLEDHLRLAEHYKRYIDSRYRFVFVGRADAVPAYYATIRALMVQYEMPTDRFVFTGPLPDEDLAAVYRASSAYISLSEHEGFCVPLVEAMAMDVPVLAYASSAVPETLGGAGLLFAPKDLEFAAEALGALVFDRDTRDAVIAGQRQRLSAFSEARLDQCLDQLLEVFE